MPYKHHDGQMLPQTKGFLRDEFEIVACVVFSVTVRKCDEYILKNTTFSFNNTHATLDHEIQIPNLQFTFKTQFKII